jgi:hypothetical protein
MSPKTPKRSPSSPNSQRKTRKNVRFSETPQEFVFERDFGPDDIKLLWSTKQDRKRAKREAKRENRANSESVQTRFGKIEKSASEFQPEEVIQLHRQKPLTNIINSTPVPEKKQGFLFRMLSRAKSLVSKKKGGINKTKRHKTRT